ncbi:hypothetical protein [Microbulbifer halophilus]|uniref:Flagellar motor protein MotB n=1 Tax=Microbulbifer halophilus TaxID=453963 RepID=A0ABW5EFK5_9GAMM|nr:hypothetical protein [Microbulbifer halophilus]MCW8127623.1 hypothetical protein [Microbulbifer halophilus]
MSSANWKRLLLSLPLLPALVVNAAEAPPADTVVKIITRSESEPAAKEELQPNRRVEIRAPEAQPGKAVAQGRFAVRLDGGGVIWATEDPARVEPDLSVSAAPLVPFERGRILEPVRFQVYSNYTAFIERLEVSVYRAQDADRLSPLARVRVPLSNFGAAEWPGDLPEDVRLRRGEELTYVLRAYDGRGNMDETVTGTLQLASPAAVRDTGMNALAQSGGTVRLEDEFEGAAAPAAADAIYGRNGLRRQSIPLHGSRVRLHGQDLPGGFNLSINGRAIPVGRERRFVAEYLVPVGRHAFDIELRRGGEAMHRQLQVDVSGRYLFLVAMADLTLSESQVSGAVEPLGEGEGYDDYLTEGRLGFYLKGKIKGRYLVTAQADTREREAGDLFSGFLEADARDIFRRLDPDQYYPVYGDDSTVHRDIDTQGRLYVRVDWDQSQALWGNFQTGIRDTEYGQYNRSLYGGALNWRSRGSTDWGEPHTRLTTFASEVQTAPGHSEFLGTGGSLYYLRHQDLLPGSEQVVVELRDPTSGRVEERLELERGVDYEIDEMQGRLILTRPLAQTSLDRLPSLTRDQPLNGYDNLLLVDYEYVPTGFEADNLAAGVRGKQWLGEHLALGGTYISEARSGDDYTLRGGDVTLQAGRGTYLKLEQSDSGASAAPIFFSDDGGLSFDRSNPQLPGRSGRARSLEARANLRQLGWSRGEWTLGGWWRHVDAGYSSARFDPGQPVRETGGEFFGELSPEVDISGRWSERRRGDEAVEQAQLRSDWALSDRHQFSGEMRRVTETEAGDSAVGTLAALGYTLSFGSVLQDIYTVGQFTLDDDGGAYADNDALTLGSRFAFGDRYRVGGESTWGDRGDASTVSAEVRRNRQHTLYGSYTYATDISDRPPLSSTNQPGGLTLGQRWRPSNQVRVFNESQWLKEGPEVGLAHTYGVDFYPSGGWRFGFTRQEASLDSEGGEVKRNAISLHGGLSAARTDWTSKLEHREDSGAERRRQWVIGNRLQHKLNESWRLSARFNYADTRDRIDTEAGARFGEANFGFAWRPWDSGRYTLLGRYTWLYDRSSLGQEAVFSEFDQRSRILSLEGIWRAAPAWEFGGKLARRHGEVREQRGEGAWFDSTTSLAALQGRWYPLERWSWLAEYRWLDVRRSGLRRGWLTSVDYDISEHFRMGLGYNFTDFSDDLSRHDYQHRGWFLNLVASY